MTNWFTEFLELSAQQWEADALEHEMLAEQAQARGGFLEHARAQGRATAYRRVARAYRRNAERLDIGPATEDHEWDCTVADLVDVVTDREVAA